MKSLFTLLCSVFLSLSICFGQAYQRQLMLIPRRPEDNLKMVKTFYKHLLNDKTVSLKETFRMFSPHILEEEAFLFENICEKDPNHTICKERGINSTGDSWDENSPSMFFMELKKYPSQFTQGYESKLDSILTHCTTVYEEGNRDLSIDVHFPNQKTIYFRLNPYLDEPLYITDIYFEDGACYSVLFDIYRSKTEKRRGKMDNYFWRHAVINDPDGFVNVRSGKGADTPIVEKITKNEVFKYSPNFYSPWWRVIAKKGKKSVEGYVHKSRILPYGNLSAKQRKSIPLP